MLTFIFSPIQTVTSVALTKQIQFSLSKINVNVNSEILYIHVTVHRNTRVDFFLKNQPEALINQIYSVIKLYMFRASSLPIIRSFLL